MRRKISLLLAVVMAMTTIMVMNVPAFAEGREIDFDATDVVDMGFIPTEETEITIYELVNAQTHRYEMYVDDKLEYYSDSVDYQSYIQWADSVFDSNAAVYFPEGTKVKHGCRFIWDGKNKIAKEYYYSVKYYQEKYEEKPEETGTHTHDFQWKTISEPTAEKDGLEAEVCSICGERRNEQPLSAYGYALNQYAAPVIEAAQPGQTTTLEFGEWNSFPKSFMDKVAAKNDVTYVFKFKYNHQRYTICIPAGIKVDYNEDWFGPLKLAELFGAIIE